MDEKARSKRRTITYLCVLGAGIVYFIWLKLTGIGIPCIFHEITGWSCPGCGVTTLIMSIAAGRLDLARSANPFLYYTWPVLVLILVLNEIKSIKGEAFKWNTLFNVLLIAYLIAFIAFGVIRNIGTRPHFVWMGESLHWLPGMMERYLP